MAYIEQEVVRILLEALHDKGKISKSTYDKANNLVHSVMDMPDFFWYSVCCQEEVE